MLIPFPAGDEKQGKHRIGHKNLISPIFSTQITDNRLCKIKILPAIRNTHHKKHGTSPYLTIL